MRKMARGKVLPLHTLFLAPCPITLYPYFAAAAAAAAAGRDWEMKQPLQCGCSLGDQGREMIELTHPYHRCFLDHPLLLPLHHHHRISGHSSKVLGKRGTKAYTPA